jgi:hypothetical protein
MAIAEKCLDNPKKCKDCWYNGKVIDGLPITHYFRRRERKK